MSLEAAYLNRPVRIINQASRRALYAHLEGNWERRIGAGANELVTEDGNWLIYRTHLGYRITNALSNRALYAHRNGNWQHRFGAGTPEDRVTDDGFWDITQNPDGSYCIVNRDSERYLYAQPDGAWTQGVGAGPEQDVGLNGRWFFIFSPMVANDEEH